MLRLLRLADRRHGWALQMAGTFKLGDAYYPGGYWIVSLAGLNRFALSTPHLQSWDYDIEPNDDPILPTRRLGE
jgi:hypothetical protein